MPGEPAAPEQQPFQPDALAAAVPAGDAGPTGLPSPDAATAAGERQRPTATAPYTSSWRTSPNDELVRQAERVKKPAAGGITTSGLPRRVPRANLVPGTAQEQSNQTGPQVSRAPDDVRGRLTNLRRGIQQGRQAAATADARRPAASTSAPLTSRSVS